MTSLRTTFAAAALALFLLPLVTAAPLVDPDEGLHAAIAQEMTLRHDYVTPTFLGEPFLDKPILFFWAEAASLRLFGMNETAVRIPPSLFGVLGMIGVAALGAAMLGETAGLVGGLVYGTMFLPAVLSEIAVHDVALTPFVCAAALGVWHVVKRHGVRRAAVVGVGIGLALGLSVLTKGLVGVAFVGFYTLCLLWNDRRAIPRLALALAIAGVVAVAVAAPWYIAMEHAHPGYLHYYFIDRHVEGYLTATQRHGGRPWWYYAPILVGGTLPWTAYLPAAWRASRGRTAAMILWAWFVVGIVFLSIGESKLVTYVLPVFPALALLAATAIASTGRPRAPFLVLVVCLAALPALALAALALKFGESRWLLWTGAAFACLAVSGEAGIAWTTRSEEGFLRRLTVVAVTGLFFVLLAAGRPAAAWMTAKPLAEALNTARTLPPFVGVVDERIGSVIFYLRPALRAQATSDRIAETSLADAVQRAQAHPDALFAIRRNALPRVERTYGHRLVPDGTAGTFLLFRGATLAR